MYYDDTYNRQTVPSEHSGLFRNRARHRGRVDRGGRPITEPDHPRAGQGLSDPALTALPTTTKAQTLASAAAITHAIDRMTPTPQALLAPAGLPVRPSTCPPLYPPQSSPFGRL